MTSPPRWVDDLFPFPTPPALARLIDIAWEHAFIEDDLYDEILLETYYDFMFDLEAVPLAPGGWEYSYPGPSSRLPRPAPLYATPELLPFGHLGNGTHIGWVVPAPELGGTDHPVAVFAQEPGARVIGRDTRAGLEFALSLGLRKDNLSDADRALIARLAAELGLRPSPEFGITEDGRDVLVPLDLAVPAGWRHEHGVYGIGVLAPSDAFAGHGPVSSERLEEILADAVGMLDAGCPATALLGLTEAFHQDFLRLTELHPLWARAYQDLGRPQYAECLDLMLPTYQDLL
ncbi:hypothetical protein ACFYT4_34160 [Streptomyces sp. NPDC004609]|uniref:hypothetical protein n=1 Tax=Streptomyces sp. NPDC004609 TaxID=3364704 RepID=UPI003678695E